MDRYRDIGNHREIKQYLLENTGVCQTPTNCNKN